MLVKSGSWLSGTKVEVVPGGSPPAARSTAKLQPPTEVTSTATVGSGSVGAQTSSWSGVAVRSKRNMHSSKAKEAMRVPQLPPGPGMYSLVNQKVQSSAGSTLIAA